MPVFQALDVMEARMDSIESAIEALGQQACRLAEGF